MWKLCVVVFMATAVLCHDKQYWNNVEDFEVVSSIDLSMSPKRSAEGVHVLKVHKYNSSMTVECIKASPFTFDSRIIISSGNSSKYLPVPSKTFKSINDNYRFRFMAHKDGTIEGILFVNEEMLVIEPASKHIDFMGPHHLEKLGSGTHVILRRNNLHHEESLGCGVCNDMVNSDGQKHTRSRRSRRAYPMGDKVPLDPPPTGCPSSLEVLRMVAVVDKSLFDNRGVDGSVDYVTNNIHNVNSIFNEELNVELIVSELLIMKDRDEYSAGWQCSRRDDVHGDFKTWTTTHYSNSLPPMALLYHDCSGGGLLGRAYVGGVCRTQTFQAEVKEMGDTRKRTILSAHEIGHLINMPHDPDNSGVMKSTMPINNLNKWLKFSRKSQAKGCTKLGNINCLSSINDEKLYILRKQNSQGHALTTQKQPNANNHNVYLYNYNDENQNQHWVETKHSTGYYIYRKRYTNYCLDGGNGGSQRQNVKIYECSQDNVNQHWEKSSVSGNTYILKKRNVAFSIDGNGGGANNQNVYLWSSSSSNQNQQWVFVTPPK